MSLYKNNKKVLLKKMFLPHNNKALLVDNLMVNDLSLFKPKNKMLQWVPMQLQYNITKIIIEIITQII